MRNSRRLIFLVLIMAAAGRAACTLTAIDWIVTNWRTDIQGTWITVSGGPSGAFRQSAGNEVYSLTPLEGWRTAASTLTITYKIDQSLNVDDFRTSDVTFQLRATYTCDGGAPTQYYYPPFTGTATVENPGYSWATIYSGTTGGTAHGVMYHSRSLSDCFSIPATAGFGPIPLTPPTPPTPDPPQERTTVRRAAVRTAAVR